MIETQVSMSEIAEVSAAKITNKKNSTPITGAKSPNDANICGSTINMRPGPEFSVTASGEPSATNAAGTIMRPAKNETPISKPATRIALEVSESRCFM